MKTTNFVIKWHHEMGVDTPSKKIDFTSGPVRLKSTTCTIQSSDGSVFSGTAVRYYKDNPCKDKARRVSMSHAMAEMSKDQRTEVWEGYRSLGGKKRW